MMNRRNLLTGCGQLILAAPAFAATPTPFNVVASFSILADFIANIATSHVKVTTLVGANGDAHVYSPSPADAKQVAGAKVVVVNGLGLEGWMERLMQAAATTALVVVASKSIVPLRFNEDGKSGDDPHAWQNIANAKTYIANIRDGLMAADPEYRFYQRDAAAYIAKLDALEAEVHTTIAKIPSKNRRIITSHDAFGYFSKAYGMEFIAPQGVSTEAEPSAKDVAKIIRQIKADKIPAVFLENISDPRLINRIAKETGAKIGGKLYSDALSGPDGPASTYIDMMRNNISAFSAALVV